LQCNTVVVLTPKGESLNCTIVLFLQISWATLLPSFAVTTLIFNTKSNF